MFFVPLFRFLNHCSVFFHNGTKKRNSVFLYHCSVFCTSVPLFPQRNKKRNSVFLYHCSVFALLFRFLNHCSVFSTPDKKWNSVFLYHCSVFLHFCSVFPQQNKIGTVCFCTTVPFFALLFPFFHNRTKKTEQCVFEPLFRFFHKETKTEQCVFVPVFRFFHKGTIKRNSVFCTTVPFFALLFYFFRNRKKRNSVLLYHYSVFSHNGTKKILQKKTSWLNDTIIDASVSISRFRRVPVLYISSST